MYRILRQLIVLASLGLGTVAAAAQALPPYYPASYDYSGIVDSTRGSHLIVGASSFAVDSNVRVHTLDTEFASLRALQPGTEVGLKFNDKPGQRRKITEIWVLPKGTVVLP